MNYLPSAASLAGFLFALFVSTFEGYSLVLPSDLVSGLEAWDATGPVGFPGADLGPAVAGQTNGASRVIVGSAGDAAYYWTNSPPYTGFGCDFNGAGDTFYAWDPAHTSAPGQGVAAGTMNGPWSLVGSGYSGPLLASSGSNGLDVALLEAITDQLGVIVGSVQEHDSPTSGGKVAMFWSGISLVFLAGLMGLGARWVRIVIIGGAGDPGGNE